ncbi:MAG: hypothetical protein ABFS46_08095 [Myxococcota bacterium]
MIAGYPVEDLVGRAIIRGGGLRPRIELRASDHPLSLEQQNGITAERLAEIVSPYLHGE